MKGLKKLLALGLAICMMIGLVPMNADAATITEKPADGTTTGAPFKQGTAGSNSFRIPALTTLSDGTIVAAADARWNTTYDGGCLDTIVSRSTDNGANWSYTFANYLGDNGNTYSGSGSTAFIDPALAVTEDDTIYMLVDIYPYGVALNGSGNTAPVTTKGFDSNGRLLLSSNNHSSYGYYLEGDTIYSTSGTAVSGYTVDEYFNITGTDGTDTNLFFSDSPYKVVRTGFLYLTKSTDKGATWSAPTLLNLKTTSEQVCLIAPGRGLVTSNGTIVFPVYSYNGSSSSQRMGFIYSTDGVNWSRSANFSYNWASESAVVELSDGTLRFFFRNGTTNLCYVDYNMSSGSWGSAVNTGIDTNSNCQISAITYSKTSDGKQVILVSCPTGPNEAGSDQSGASYRLNGKIFTGLVNEDNTMTWPSSISVTSNNNQFMYSCLTELADGSVSILYENCENAWGAGSSCYYTMDYKTYSADDFGVTFDADGHNYETVTVEATCEEDGSVTYTCTKCGDSYEEIIPALGHDYETVTVEATCEEDGSITTECTNCGDKTIEVLEAIGHNYETVTVEATCETAGGITHTCTNCGDSYLTDEVEAFGHDYETVTVEATCEEAGSVTKTCANCGDTTVEVLEALGHNYVGERVEATCTTDGYVSETCTNCGDSTEEVLVALGHDYETITVEATCEKDGSVTTTCANCGDSTEEVLEALGHNYKTVTVEATCTTDGYTKHTCANCHDSYTTDETAAFGHSYKSEQVGNNMVYTCENCGDSYTESLAVNYTYDKVTAFTSGENYVITLYSGRKYYAVTHENNTLSAVQVTVSNNQITSEITEDMLWTYENSKLSYKDDDTTYYLYAGSSSNSGGGWFDRWFGGSATLSVSASDSSTVSISSNRLKVGSYYLRYSSGTVKADRSSTTTYLYMQNEE